MKERMNEMKMFDTPPFCITWMGWDWDWDWDGWDGEVVS